MSHSTDDSDAADNKQPEIIDQQIIDQLQVNPVVAMSDRFRGFLPVVVDVETGGFNSRTDALLEVAVVTLAFDKNGQLEIKSSKNYQVEPFGGANIEDAALQVNGIRPFSPLRMAREESEVMKEIFKELRAELKAQRCKRVVLVGHNAAFDLGFVKAAADRNRIKNSPFHPFSTFDTVSLAGLAYGQTVLARAAKAAGLEWDDESAHSALYDAKQTARLFCRIVNAWPYSQTPKA